MHEIMIEAKIAQALLRLGLATDPGPVEIRRTFHELAKEYHPDRQPAHPTEFNLISDAYSFLMSRSLQAPQFASRDLLQAIKAKQSTIRSPTNQSFVRITLSLRELHNGGQIVVHDPRSGAPITLPIRPGTRPGATVRWSTFDDAMERYDRQLRIQIDAEPHSSLRLIGDSIYSDISVTPDEQRAELRTGVVTLDGTVTLRLPKQLVDGQIVRLRNKGFHRRNGRRGDHLIRLQLLS